MSLAELMVWRESTNHENVYYFCFTPPVKADLSLKKRGIVQYPNLPSAIRQLNPAFNTVLEGAEKEVWEALKNVIHGFLGNKREDN